MNFVTLFPEAENVHLIKSCGMVPFVLHKYFGYNSTIVTYNNDNYEYLNSEVKGLEIEYIKKIFNNKLLDSIYFLLKKSKSIDVLHVYHLSKRSLLCGMVYKILNSDGIVYLKLDNTDKDLFGKKYSKSLMVNLKFKLMKVFDIISTESIESKKYINKNFPLNFEYIQNGFYSKRELLNIEKKENVILTVSRIGVPQKSNEVMLEGFALASSKIPTWKLRLIGPIEESFKDYMRIFFNIHPHLKDRVEFVGPITDRKKLNTEYEKAKIFSLTSNYEGFPTVFLEAIKSGCYLISSDFNVAQEITKYGELGLVFDVGDYEGYSKALIKACSNEEMISDSHQKIQDFAYEHYYWPTTASKLHALIEEKVVRN